MHTADIVIEIHRLGARRGWSQSELARQLGVNRSVLVHARGGRRTLTAPVLARVARVFGDVPMMKELVWGYLRYEHPVGSEELGVLPQTDEPDTSGLTPAARAALRKFVRTFPQRLVDGRGLVLRGSSAKVLSLAADTVTRGLSAAGVLVARRLALDPVGPTEAAYLKRVRLLVLERVDGGGLSGRLLVAESLATERPLVVTTAGDLVAVLGVPLARDLAARCPSIVVDECPAAPHA